MKVFPTTSSSQATGFVSQARRVLASLLWNIEEKSPRRGRLLLEQLEGRQMMAADSDMLFTDGVSMASTTASSNSSFTSSTTTAEGEAAPNLVAFAKALSDAGVKFYGAIWCPFCAEQKALFEDGYKFLPFIEVTKADHTLNAVGTAANITTFPTWEFPDGSRATGVQTLATLSTRSGVAIPTSDNPSFATIGSQTLAIGSPLNVPVDAYDPGGGPVTITVSVADPTLLTATVLAGNRSVRFDMDTYGDMVFQLFEQDAPRPAGRMIALANSNFYDGQIFHRVIDNFVIQGGDPTGTGTGGSTLGNFDDQFNVDLQHNRSGVLSYAKTTDDTNDSQFFITDTATRSLDFNHSIFGQLVEGDDVRNGISNLGNAADKGTNSSDKPLIDVKIKSVDVFTDNENAVVRLKAIGNRAGTTNVTFTATDANGNTFVEVVPVTVVADSGTGSNSQPFLADIPTPASAPNTAPVTLQLSSTDVEGDAVTYTASSATTGVTATVNATGLVTVTPSAGFTGNAIVNVAVKPASGVTGTLSGQDDNQKVTFAFTSAANTLAAPTSVDLATASDTGASSTDNITNAGSLTFAVAGVQAGNEIRLFANNTEIGRSVATGTTVNITTNNVAPLGDGTYTITARQFSSSGSNSSVASPGLSVTYDATQPIRITGFPASANVNTALNVNLSHPEEGSGLVYSFTSAPTGATINATSGVITWTPSTAQLGNQSFTLALTDIAGNVRSETFPVVVANVPLAGFRLEVANTAGTVVTNVAAGDEFLLRFYAQDLRGTFDVHGIFSAYADIMFDSTKVTPVGTGTSSITYSSAFANTQEGTLSSGLINELGAVSTTLAATDVNEALVATIRMKATGSGTVSFITDPADDSGNDFTLFDKDDAVDKSLIKFGRTDLTIGNRFTAANDTFTVAQGAAATSINVLQNDAFTSGTTGTLTVTSVGTPSSGGATTIVNNAISYKPAATFAGTETFTYVATDNTGATQTATVTVNVTATNNPPPTAVADAFTVVEDAAEASFNVRSNDTTSDAGETISVSAVGTPSKGGTVRLGTDGASIFYKPATNFSGTETVTYTLLDSRGATATGTVTFTVTAVNDPPPASAITKDVFRSSTAITVATLTDYGTNLDGTAEVLTVALVGTASAGGTFTVSGTSITYTPPSATFTGTDTISYKTTDTGGLTTTGLITLHVVAASPTAFELNLVGQNGTDLVPAISANLSGTTTSGQTVTRTVALGGSNSSAQFDNLAPGNYQVQIPAIPFLIGMEQAKSVSFVATEAGGSKSDSISFGTLNPVYISIRDFFNNAPKKAIFAVVAPGSDSLVVLGAQSVTSTITSPVVSLNQAGDSITIKGKNSTGADTQATVAAGANSKVETRATSSGLKLLKISLEAADATFAAPTTTTTSVSSTNDAPTSAEGEASSASQLAAPAASAANLFASNFANADGEDLAAGENAKEDVPTDAEQATGGTAAVDQALADVTNSLTRISTTGDALAEDNSTPPDAAAVDQLLSSSVL